MSAFIVEPDTMHAAVQGFVTAERAFGRNADPTDIGRQLYRLNYDAIHARYPDTVDHPENVPGVPVEVDGYRWSPRTHYTKCAMYKALRCLKYQCSEGDVPEEPLYEKLVQAIDVLGYEIISDLPDFKRAGTWN